MDGKEQTKGNEGKDTELAGLCDAASMKHIWCKSTHSYPIEKQKTGGTK